MIKVTIKTMFATMRCLCFCLSFCLKTLKCCDREYKALFSDACDSFGAKESVQFFATKESASCFTAETEAVRVHNELKN